MLLWTFVVTFNVLGVTVVSTVTVEITELQQGWLLVMGPKLFLGESWCIPIGEACNCLTPTAFADVANGELDLGENGCTHRLSLLGDTACEAPGKVLRSEACDGYSWTGLGSTGKQSGCGADGLASDHVLP